MLLRKPGISGGRLDTRGTESAGDVWIRGGQNLRGTFGYAGDRISGGRLDTRGTESARDIGCESRHLL